MKEQKWHIYSVEHGAFWNQNRVGYTLSRERAGRFTFDEALAIVTDGNRHNSKPFTHPNETMCPVWD